MSFFDDLKKVKKEVKKPSTPRKRKKGRIPELGGNGNKFVKLRLIHLVLFGKELRLKKDDYIDNIVKKLTEWKSDQND